MEVDPWILAAADATAKVGTVFPDLQTRTRYRVNGVLSHPHPDTIELRVLEAYGNCPKYITRRKIAWDRHGISNGGQASGERLSTGQQRTISNADMLFIATGHPERGLDASHRGGNPGFITIVDDRTFYFPDYPGNSLYNSLGNLLVDNRIGLLVPDLTHQRALRITGNARVEFLSGVRKVTTANAPVRVQVSVSNWMETDLPVSSSHWMDYSPYNP
jgi:uncharacterized protein